MGCFYHTSDEKRYSLDVNRNFYWNFLMTQIKKNQPSDVDDLTKLRHLVTAESRGKPICGEASPDALIGSYFEHLDDEREFVREVFGKDGKPATACQQCLALYPSLVTPSRDHRELKRITPFNVRINLAFAPDTQFSGYWVTANGTAGAWSSRAPRTTTPSAR
jgi:hypothetical protein